MIVAVVDNRLLHFIQRFTLFEFDRAQKLNFELIVMEPLSLKINENWVYQVVVRVLMIFKEFQTLFDSHSLIRHLFSHFNKKFSKWKFSPYVFKGLSKIKVWIMFGKFLPCN